MTVFRSLSQTTGLPRIAGALLLLAVSAGVFAPASANAAYGYTSGNSSDSRIDQLEKQIQTLSRAVYRGEKMPEGAMQAETASISAYEGRIGQLEGQQRDMTGKIERLEYDVQQIKDRLDKLSMDLEQRFQQLETASASAPAATAAASTADTSTVTAPPQPANDTTALVAAPTTQGVLGSTNDGATGLYESAFADIRSSKFESAETKLKKFMSQYPKHKLAGNAQYWLAETHYVRGDYAGAAQMFAQGYQDYPKGSKAPDSLLKLGLSLSKLGKKEDACLSFGQLQAQFPGDNTVSGRAAQEMKTLGCKG